MNIPAPSEYIAQLGRILGVEFIHGEATIRISWNNREEGNAALQRLRLMQKEIRLLKQHVAGTITAIRSEFTTARAQIGKGLGDGLAAMLLGRRSMGGVHVVQRDQLRRQQANAIEPYETVKRQIDRALGTLDELKGRIELSPQYQEPTERPLKRVSALPVPELPRPVALPPAPAVRYYVYLANEVKGPYTLDQLSALRDAGAITATTQFCVEGGEDWQLIPHFLGD